MSDIKNPSADESANSSDNNKGKKKRGAIITILGVVVLLIGAGFVAYPYIGTYFVGQTQKEIQNKIEEAIAFAQKAKTEQQGSGVETREFAFDEDTLEQEETENGFQYDESTGYLTWMVDAAPQSEEDDIDPWFDPTTGEQLETVASSVDLVPGSTLPPDGKRVLVLRGMIRIDKIGVYLSIVDGTGATELRYAVGRWRGGAMIGEEGNCLIAGHRNYTFGNFFNRLNEVEIGDEIIITDINNNTYTYIIDDINIVEPGDISVSESLPGERRLTLQTCHPLYVGSHRLIVTALLKPDDELIEFEVGDY